jgi:peptidylprolyl isomerase/peptidyl-prolyl cis-trans isomerase C
MSEKSSAPSVKSYHAAHILVPNRHEADDILRKLRMGSDFHELARKFSSCASAVNGGDLGLIKPGKAHEDFEEAALKLKFGETSKEPVRTPFGYHIIRRLE